MIRNLADSLRAEQATLLRYWQNARGGARAPLRSEINPGDLRPLLSGLSILEIGPADQARFRLAGSHVCDVFGSELRGTSVQKLDGELGAWDTAIERAIDNAEPQFAFGYSGTSIGHAWMRLPLVCDATDVDLVLCLDRYPTGRVMRGPERVAA